MHQQPIQHQNLFIKKLDYIPPPPTSTHPVNPNPLQFLVGMNFPAKWSKHDYHTLAVRHIQA